MSCYLPDGELQDEKKLVMTHDGDGGGRAMKRPSFTPVVCNLWKAHNAHNDDQSKESEKIERSE